ncbi:MAG TPA: hypothetical protein VHA33_20100 [Candidatus Angelobacter sp.]|jgi:hypothetical protein|nr:hypothetical protein [Candidatus Angelobacter sp.]
MRNQQNQRVLTRTGARELTPQEAAHVSGAGTAPCQLTGAGHGTATDIFCPDCPDC